MDPVTLIAAAALASGICAVAGGSAGFLLGFQRGRHRSDHDFEDLKRERDKALELASSRKIEWAGWPEKDELIWVQVPEWKERDFDDSVTNNLTRISNGLKAAEVEGRLLTLHVKFSVSGTWRKSLKEFGWNFGNANESTTTLGVMERRFNGTAEEIASELKTFLFDNHWGFVSAGKVRHAEAPMRIVCELWRSEIRKAPQKPEVKVVEVTSLKTQPEPHSEEQDASRIAAVLETDHELARRVDRIRASRIPESR